MYVRAIGDRGGAAVVLLHGGGVAGWMWDPVAEMLSSGHSLLIPDLPGHDRSSGESYVSHEHTVRRLVTVIEEHTERGVVVVGFSLGAQLAVLLAAQRPDLVDGVVVISAQAKPTPAPGITLALLAATAPLAKQRWFARLQAKELFVPPSLLNDYVRTSALLSRETLVTTVRENMQFMPPREWGEFPGRALVLAGEEERGFMKDSARSLQRALLGSELELVPGCAHGIPLQRPDWLARRLLDWLSRGD